jgi:hypothetical protein
MKSWVLQSTFLMIKYLFAIKFEGLKFESHLLAFKINSNSGWSIIEVDQNLL